MPRSFKNIRLWTDFDENLYELKIMKTHLFHKIIYDLKCHFYAMEKFMIFFTLRPSDLISTFLWTTFVLVYLCSLHIA